MKLNPPMASVATPSPLNGERAGVRGENSPRRPYLAVTIQISIASWFLASVPGVAAPAADPFTDGAVWRVRLEVPAEGLASLRRNPRQYVRGTFREGTNTLQSVAVRLKGSLGSFRPLDDKPAFTVDFDQFTANQRWRGLARAQLNNSVEDGSYLHEKLGSELFRAAGVPAPRVAHALVELNDRRLGLYVLKEGFDALFLARHFARADGTLYESDPGGGRDVTEPMPRSGGAGRAEDEAGLRRLAVVLEETDPALRWSRLGDVLDRERFLSFMAMEILVGHRDGYCTARNNFRLYHDPAADRFVFLPDGMDQLLGRANWPLQPQMAGAVARAVIETPTGRHAYRGRLGTLFTNHLNAGALSNRVQAWAAAIAPQLPRSEAQALRNAAADLGARLDKRAFDVARQLALPQPAPIAFTNGVAHPDNWRAVDAPPGGLLDQTPAPDGRAALHIVAGPTTAASWRAKVWLEPGRYRFEGRARTAGVKPLAFGRNHGASVSVAGRSAAGVKTLLADTDWTRLVVEFNVADRDSEVDLLCALRAAAGQVWFDVQSLRLVRDP